ncbi:DUF3626 domain-containing protein [Streptomyces sp. CA-294286]|uniref:DUF3626 domain-containing protein n=1 Tax=Streptomyces sp. CA-294286 TaxID=3240070 RepID=UPI003D8EF49C
MATTAHTSDATGSPAPARLTDAQRAALRHVRGVARADAPPPGALPPDAAELLVTVRDHARITLNFHPDRLLADGRTLAASLADDGVYRSQYETGLSNGSRTAFPGGLRDGWEEALFGGAYHAAGVRPAERPKYGALNLRQHPDGAAPRFGSCHVRLRSAVNARATFCHHDSHLGPAHVGTADSFAPVLAALLAEQPDAADLVRALPHAAAPVSPGRSLDAYVEAQVHGPLSLAEDAEALVLDPSFDGTETGRLLAELAARSGTGVEWHAGFALRPQEVDAEFRGPVMVPLAARICSSYARRGVLDAEVLGRAAASVVREPAAWAEWGAQDEVLQYVKQLWHVLVRFGHPAHGGRGNA